jgi:hypothetical protein
MVFKGASWQLCWRDTDNQVQWTGSGTDDAAEAQKILARLALPRAAAMAAQLERIANGEETYRDPSKSGDRPRSGSVAVGRRTPAAAAQKARRKATRKGGKK